MSKRTTEDTERDLKRAMRLYGEVIAHDNPDVEALWGFGTATLRLDRNLDLAETEKRVVERDKVDAENKQQREKCEKELAEYEKKYGKVKKKPAG